MVDSNYERVASSLAQIQERKQGNIEVNSYHDQYFAHISSASIDEFVPGQRLGRQHNGRHGIV